MPGPQGIKGNRGDTGGAGQIVFIVLLHVSSISEIGGRSYSQKYFLLILQIRHEAGGHTKISLCPLKVLQCLHLINLSLL